jgi:hypothetical protein
MATARKAHWKALRERDQRVLAGVRRQVVLRARHGHGRDDGDAECRSDLEAGFAETGGKPRLASGDAAEGCDQGGDEDEADAGTEDEQPEEDVAEVAAACGDLGEKELRRPSAPSRSRRPAATRP